MKANEARELAAKCQLKEIKPILDRIKTMASNGKTSTYWYKSVRLSTIKELEDLGYKTSVDNSRNEYLLTINW